MERERMRAVVLVVVVVGLLVLGLDWWRTRDSRPPVQGLIFVDYYGPR